MIDAVLSHHLNPYTCGVAKFNAELAKRLGVPMLPIGSTARWPLLSIKPSEMLNSAIDVRGTYDLFLHGPMVGPVLTKAQRVYVGNRELAETLRPFRPDVIEAFCPSTVDGNATRGQYRVLTFGMSHKLLLPHFQRLKSQLDREHPEYTIELSTAVHEGNPWDQALTASVDAMRGIFGDRLRVLGFLGDDALARALEEVDAVACFYTPALRANNTSYWTAVEAGKTIYTNRDELSPREGDPPASWGQLVERLRA
jgi:hypothetical protein